MKSSKRKQVGHDVEIKAPSSEDWENIVRDLKLTPVQERTLKTVLDAALDDISRYHQKLKDQPSRERLVRRLKRFTKVLGYLRDECERSIDLMQDFLPYETLAYIGQSVTFSAMSDALGRDVFPRHFDLNIDRMRASGERITLASLEQGTRPLREALGLKHGHVILMYLIERMHTPLARWIELNRRNKGGRKSNAVRWFLIHRLAESAIDIVGKPATVSSTGKLVELCTAVLVACGLPEAGIAKAVPGVVSKLRRDEAS
jgi:hypothetical protein